MKLALIATLAVVPVLGTNGPILGTQQSPVTIERSDDGAPFRVVHTTPYPLGWVGLMLRDTVTGRNIRLIVRWPVVQCDRIGE